LKKIIQQKWVKYPFVIAIVFFAIIGLFLSSAYIAVKFKLTNDPGHVDHNNRYFQDMKDKYNQSFKMDSLSAQSAVKTHEALERILILNKYCPKNADYILNVFKQSEDETEVLRMLDAVDMYLQDNQQYLSEIAKYQSEKKLPRPEYIYGSIFEWMNISEWTDFKLAVAKDKQLIDSVANLTGVESRLIVSVLVGEQIRLFNSNREAYKKWIGPLKILSVETQFSFGVTGIKEHTAQKIEYLLKDTASEYYLGKPYENLLNFRSDSIQKERLDRLTSYKNHFYSYMYAALFLKQVKIQWERAGFPIDKRPEILATLFNIGFVGSIPKENPRVGGSTIKIYDKPHSFGSISYEFYYSGELFELFPITLKKFDWNVR
jgi:hypothetical protein